MADSQGPPQKGGGQKPQQGQGGRKRKRTELTDEHLRKLIDGDFQEDDEYQELAREFLERKKQRNAQRATTRGKGADDGFVYYLQCPVCRGHGIYFVSRPLGKPITSEQWFSVYKSVKQPWMNEAVYCQECWERGTETPLRVSMARNGRSFSVRGSHIRFLFKVAKDGSGREERATRMAASMEYTAEDAADDLVLAGKRKAAVRARVDAEMDGE